jgi:hypothetical protein
MKTGLRDALQRNDGKMATPGEIADVEQEPGSGLATNECLGRGARSTPGPAWAWLEAGQAGGMAAAMVDFVRRGRSEPGVRSVSVVPRGEERQVMMHSGESVGDESQPARALGLEGPDGALDHGQAAVLADGAEVNRPGFPGDPIS